MSIEMLEEIIDSKFKSEQEQPKKEDGSNNEVQTKIESVTEQEQEIQEDSIENLKKELESKNKALNDTKRSYQTVNQKYVLGNKKLKAAIEELQNTLLSPDNTLLDEEEFNAAVNKLKSTYEFKEEELESKELDEKEVKSKNIFSKLESELETYKKYNKSKDIDVDYKAFFDFAHYLNVDQRNSLVEYLEEVEPTEAIEKLSMMGKDFKNSLEKGIKKHGDILTFVNSLNDEVAKRDEIISKLNEEINKYKLSVDNSFDRNDNKQIKHRTSSMEHRKQNGDDLLDFIMQGR